MARTLRVRWVMMQHTSDLDLALVACDEGRDELLPLDVSRLSDGELLRLLIGKPSPVVGDSLNELSRASLPELMARGISEHDAQIVFATFELGRRSRKGSPLPQALRTPDEAYAYVLPHLEDAERERFVVIVLDVRNRPRHLARVAEGSVDHCMVDPRDVFAPAIREHGTAVLVAHNHPSGDPTPSREDIELTRRLVNAGDVIGLPVLDHLIVATGPLAGERPFLSLAETGVMLGDRVIGESRKQRKAAVRDSEIPRRRRRKKKPHSRA